MPFQESKDHIFINYSRKDSDFVDDLYALLNNEGYRPWMDRRDILPGEDWRRVINRAVRNCAVFIAVLSKNSVERRGELQKEITTALEEKRGKLPGDIFIIPVKLDDCDVPECFENIQVIDWNGGGGKDMLLKAVNVSYAKQDIAL